ncbi:MAG: hypothetical protein EVB11_00165 [Winogradskyella sp.]|nr:MAG: hypothetical protein EVB11_00165 [Winogradskyella sp.]
MSFKKKHIIYFASNLLILPILVKEEFSLLEIIAIFISLNILIDFVFEFGKKIVILEAIAAIASVEVLLMPALVFHYDPDVMYTSSYNYFFYIIPSFLALMLAFKIRIFKRRNDTNYFENAKEYLSKKKNITKIYALIIIGGIALLLKKFLPPGLQFLFSALSLLLKVSLLFILISNSSKSNKWIFSLIILFSVASHDIGKGMFGDIMKWMLLWLIIITAFFPYKISFKRKLIFLSFGLYALLVIQVTKAEYRKQIWNNDINIVEQKEDGGIIKFTTIVKDNIFAFDKLFSADNLTKGPLRRLNSGIVISNLINYVPKKHPHLYGTTLSSIYLAFIPRAIWKNKPKVSGRDYIKKYTTMYLSPRNSIEISPIGEGYLNFGGLGFIAVFFWALFIKCIYDFFFAYSHKIKILFLWLPAIMVGLVTCMENSIKTTTIAIISTFIIIIFINLLLFAKLRFFKVTK